MSHRAHLVGPLRIRLRLIPLRAIVMTALVLGCVAVTGPRYDELGLEPKPIPAAAAAYYDIAWLAPGILALAAPLGPSDSSIFLMDVAGRPIDAITLEKRPACVVRIALALTRLPTGELGFAETCVHDSSNPPTTSELFAYNIQAQLTRSLGPTSEPPKVMTWRNDMSSAVYTAEGSLCATLYRHDAQDGPLPVEVSLQGHRMPLGEELASAADRCTQFGNADFPVYAPDGRTLALVASYADGVHGQERIDRPWALMVVSDEGTSMTVLDGIRHPGGLAWLTSEVLVFTGDLGSNHGLWAVRRDGSKLIRVSASSPRWMSLAPDGSAAVGIITNEKPDDPDTSPNEIVWYDLHELPASGPP
jgi:hypothetical protein